jgi:hypothetical protein
MRRGGGRSAAILTVYFSEHVFRPGQDGVRISDDAWRLRRCGRYRRCRKLANVQNGMRAAITTRGLGDRRQLDRVQLCQQAERGDRGTEVNTGKPRRSHPEGKYRERVQWSVPDR